MNINVEESANINKQHYYYLKALILLIYFLPLRAEPEPLGLAVAIAYRNYNHEAAPPTMCSCSLCAKPLIPAIILNDFNFRYNAECITVNVRFQSRFLLNYLWKYITRFFRLGTRLKLHIHVHARALPSRIRQQNCQLTEGEVSDFNYLHSACQITIF